MTHGARIYIVEDDLVSAQYLKEMLESEGFEVVGSSDTGKGAVEALRECHVDVVLMDIILKGAMTGSEAALQIRRMHSECRIIFLTAYADDEMIDYAVDAHAFAYLMKPYREREIVATIKTALGKSTKTLQKEGDIELGHGYVFDKTRRMLFKEGKLVPLTPRKLALVEILALNKNSIVSNEQISMHIWQEPKADSTLRSLIKRLHDTIGEELVSNISGVGYSIQYR